MKRFFPAGTGQTCRIGNPQSTDPIQPGGDFPPEQLFPRREIC